MKRYSKQREVILSSLQNRKDHPTADMLYLDLKKELPDIGIATVYRNLAELCNEGTIQKVKTKTSGPDRFDGNIKPHVHLECETCKNVYDIFPDKDQYKDINEAMKKIAKMIKAEALGSSILIHGVCQDCKSKS